MSSQILKEFRSLSQEQLVQKVDDARRQIFALCVQVVTQHVPAYSTTKRALRKQIAQGLTVARELQQRRGGDAR